MKDILERVGIILIFAILGYRPTTTFSGTTFIALNGSIALRSFILLLKEKENILGKLRLPHKAEIYRFLVCCSCFQGGAEANDKVRMEGGEVFVLDCREEGGREGVLKGKAFPANEAVMTVDVTTRQAIRRYGDSLGSKGQGLL